MARSSLSAFAGLLGTMARGAAKQQRKAEAERRRQLRAQLQTQRAAERARAIQTKEERQRHVEEQIAATEERTAELADRVNELRQVLQATLTVDDTINFDSLRITEPFPPFNQKPSPTVREEEHLWLSEREQHLLSQLEAGLSLKEEEFLARIQPPSGLAKLLPGSSARYQASLEEARSEFRHVLEEHGRREADRQRALAQAQQDYESAKAAYDVQVAERNTGVDDFVAAYQQGDPKAVAGYSTMVLERSEYPEGFPQEFRVAYVSESKELVVDYELPGPDVVPKVAEVRYVKTKDTFEEKARKVAEIKDIYQDIVAAIALRTCHELFEADQGQRLALVAFNGFVQTVDPSTGRDIRPCLISLRVTRERFHEIDLSRVDKKVCLRNLGAQVSPRPYEVQAVKPIVEFDMVDKRFVEQSDILADLESRPNLMDLNPFEFENLVSNLFKQLGLETRLTRSSRDGGVDAVAYDVRPVIGGKVVIQAKRYRNTVGVAAVRDLFGTMMNEGANKGILVTTSGYGPDAFDFAKDKPIELLDGGRLLYLLEQVGVKARIVFPTEDVDLGA
jgi:restriction system protein